MTNDVPNDDSGTLLLIDDHPMLRNGVKQLLSMVPGLRMVGEASDGEQGVILEEELDPDLILLDLNMHGMNGLETLVRLREKALSGRVVVFSVSDHEDDVVSALKTGPIATCLKTWNRKICWRRCIRQHRVRWCLAKP